MQKTAYGERVRTSETLEMWRESNPSLTASTCEDGATRGQIQSPTGKWLWFQFIPGAGDHEQNIVVLGPPAKFKSTWNTETRMYDYVPKNRPW